jgi:hypothetical protein
MGWILRAEKDKPAEELENPGEEALAVQELPLTAD